MRFGEGIFIQTTKNLVSIIKCSIMSFEATFAKAMRLLHSPNEDAADQLKAMLDETQTQKKAPQAIVSKQPPTVRPVVMVNKAPPTPILVPSDESCVVCKRSEQVAGNEIVECQECHIMYHQECHKPSLANENLKDPRFVWYCSSCKSKRKKVKLPAKPSVLSTGNGSTSKDTKEQKDPDVSPFKSWSFLKK